MSTVLRKSIVAKNSDLGAHPPLKFLLPSLLVLLGLIVALWGEHIDQWSSIRITRLEWAGLIDIDDDY